jgi:hypothetical protein
VDLYGTLAIGSTYCYTTTFVSHPTLVFLCVADYFEEISTNRKVERFQKVYDSVGHRNGYRSITLSN